jgi:pimeloyl-ACP methyl ester carboxylesterase
MNVFKSEKAKLAVFASYDRLLKAWGVEYEERYLEGSFGRTHVILAGNSANPPLLLFHGVGDNSALMWIYNAKGLCERFRIIAIDTMGGAGKSEPGPGYGKGFSLRAWQGEILDALKIDTCYAAGVSYGSYMVQLLTASFPDRVARVAAMAGALYCSGARKASNRRMMSIVLPALLFPLGKNGGKARLLQALTGPKRERIFMNPELYAHWNLLFKHHRGPIAQRFHKREEFLEADIAVIKGKSLFLTGDKDELFYEQAIGDFQKNGVVYRILEGVGHTLNHEEPEITNKMVSDFLLDGKIES